MADLSNGEGCDFLLPTRDIRAWYVGGGGGGHEMHPQGAVDDVPMVVRAKGIVPYAQPTNARVSLRLGGQYNGQLPYAYFPHRYPVNTPQVGMVSTRGTVATSYLPGVDFGGYGVPTAQADVFTAPSYDQYSGTGLYEPWRQGW